MHCHENFREKNREKIDTRRQRGKIKQNHTPEGCKETENAERGAHCICESVIPFISKRFSRGSAPTAKI